MSVAEYNFKEVKDNRQDHFNAETKSPNSICPPACWGVLELKSYVMTYTLFMFQKVLFSVNRTIQPFTVLWVTSSDTHRHTCSFSYHSLWKWDLKLNGFWGGNLRDQLETSGLKKVCVSGVHSDISLCPLLAKVFGLPVEPCYQILKMLSCPPRLSTTAGDMSPSPVRISVRYDFLMLVFLLLIPSHTRSV